MDANSLNPLGATSGGGPAVSANCAVAAVAAVAAVGRGEHPDCAAASKVEAEEDMPKRKSEPEPARKPKRGRPHSAKPLDKTVVVRLSEEQFARLESDARASGRSVSAFVRDRLHLDDKLGTAADSTSPEQNEPANETAAGVYDKGKSRSRQIAAQALEAYSQLGFNQVSLREIASQCGLSHQALMHYFPTKDDLIRAALELRDARLVQHFATGVSVDELIGMATDNESRPGHVAMFNSAVAEASNPDHIAHGYYAEFYSELVAALAKAQVQAQFGDKVPAQSTENERSSLAVSATDNARMILAMMDGLQLQWLYRKQEFSVSTLLQTAAQKLGIASGNY